MGRWWIVWLLVLALNIGMGACASRVQSDDWRTRCIHPAPEGVVISAPCAELPNTGTGGLVD